MAYMPGAKTVANIGLGSGMTTHTMLGYDNIQRLDTIEIEPAMVAAASGFGEFVERAFNDPRSQIHIEDAKTFFSLNNSEYDIIVAEPSNPWVSGVSSLFTTEFYASITRHIVDGGLFVQWIQLYEFNNGLAESILKAMSQNFSDFVIYSTNNGDLVVIARNDGPVGNPDWSAMFANGVEAQLAKYGIRHEGDIEFRRLLDRVNLDPLLQASDVPANSDYYPYVDLNAGLARFKKTKAEMFDNWSLAPIPILEMLQGYAPVYDDLTIEQNKARLRQHGEARWLFDRVVNNVSEEDLDAAINDVSDRATAVAYRMQSALQQCELYGGPGQFRYALHDLMIRTLPFISGAEAATLVNVAASTVCRDEQQLSAGNWLNLYAAVAERNPSDMFDAGHAVLSSHDEYPRVMHEYALAAVLMGAISMGNDSAAGQIWRASAESLYSEEMPPQYLRLLSSIALD
jgi:hypothetical protein